MFEDITPAEVSPLALVAVALPLPLVLVGGDLGVAVQRAEDVARRVRLGQEQAQVQVLPHDVKVVGDGGGQELGARQVEAHPQVLAAHRQVAVLLLPLARRRGVDPVELVGRRQQLELLELELELPDVGDEVEEVRRRLGRPVLDQILEEPLDGVDEPDGHFGGDEGEDPLLVVVPEHGIVHGHPELERLRL